MEVKRWAQEPAGAAEGDGPFCISQAGSAEEKISRFFSEPWYQNKDFDQP